MNRKFAVIALGVLVGVVAAAMATGAGAAPPVCDPEDTECGGGGGGPESQTADLTVVRTMGTVSSAPAGIDCGTDCTDTWDFTIDCSINPDCTYTDVVTVTLTASGGPAGYSPNWTVCNANATGSACSSIEPDPRPCDDVSSGQCSMDMKGNYRVSLAWVDTAAPLQPSVAGPAEIGSGLATFTASASDNSGQVVRVDFFVDDVLRASDTFAPFQFGVTGTSFAHGTSHDVTARAFDAAGNMSAISGEKAFTVDRQTAVTIDSPAEGGHFETAPQFAFTIDADASASCQTLAGTSGDTVLHTAACTGSYTPQVSSPGDYRVRVTATDDAGNQAVDLRSFTIDPAADPGPGGGPGPGDPADPADPAPTGRTIARRLTIAFRKGKIRGVVKSSGGCARGEIVKAFKVLKGKDPVVGKDTTDRSGRYVIRKRGGAGRFYTRVMRSGNGLDTCAAARSKALIFANPA